MSSLLPSSALLSGSCGFARRPRREAGCQKTAQLGSRERSRVPGSRSATKARSRGRGRASSHDTAAQAGCWSRGARQGSASHHDGQERGSCWFEPRDPSPRVSCEPARVSLRTLPAQRRARAPRSTRRHTEGTPCFGAPPRPLPCSAAPPPPTIPLLPEALLRMGSPGETVPSLPSVTPSTIILLHP